MLFLLNRFFGGRYGPFLRAGLGVALVVVGLVSSWKVVILVGAVFIVWGLATGMGTLTGRGKSSSTDGGGLLGNSTENERARFGR